MQLLLKIISIIFPDYINNAYSYKMRKQTLSMTHWRNYDNFLCISLFLFICIKTGFRLHHSFINRFFNIISWMSFCVMWMGPYIYLSHNPCAQEISSKFSNKLNSKRLVYGLDICGSPPPNHMMNPNAQGDSVRRQGPRKVIRSWK
jgi:hypothetical protein